MIYKDSKPAKSKQEDWRAPLKTKLLNRSQKENKEKSRSNIKNDLTPSIKKSANMEKAKFNMTGQVKKEEKKSMLISGEVGSLLKALKGNLKNQRTLKTQKQTEMTEEDINKLFGEDDKNSANVVVPLRQHNGKNKIKATSPTPSQNFSNTDTKLLTLKTKSMRFQINQILNMHEERDFADSIKFLAQEQGDKMLEALQDNNLHPIQPESGINKTAKFKQEFVVGKQLGQGSYGTVRVAVWTTLNKKVAIKIYEKKKINEPQRRRSVRREIKILQRVEHPNIIKIYDVIETNNHVNLIMEFVQGISLGSMLKVQPSNKFTQKESRKIIVKLVGAIQYLHSMSVSHRDIKLDNILMDSVSLEPKLIDFGFSTCINQQKKVKMFCGTPSFMAPEIVTKKQYKGAPADVWALGVVLYTIVTGIFPFKGNTDNQLYERICASDYAKPIASKSLLHLLENMLKVDAHQRITADQILLHPWIKNTQSNKALSPQIKISYRNVERVSSKVALATEGGALSLSKKFSKEKKPFQQDFSKGNQNNIFTNIDLLKDFIPKKQSKIQTCTNRESPIIVFPEPKKQKHKEKEKDNKISRLTNLAYL